MPSHFDLVIDADPSTFSAELVLLDERGARLARRRTDFGSIPASRLQALFDLQNYLRFYVEPGRRAEALARVGVSIAEEVLGEEIFLKLWRPTHRRTLRVRLPGAAKEENLLAAALARVPWEIARPSADRETLAGRNLLVRVVHEMEPPPTEPLALGDDECLRVLFVFAQARESRPLAARLERNRLRELFEKEVYPGRRVVADFLTHGVTRERLEAQVAEQGGYHVVHWSGHGHLNVLELAKPGGASDAITGERLLELFVDAGGFIPRLFFLSACHSGDILRVRSWGDFLAVAGGDEPDARRSAPPPNRDILVEDPPGYTGTAHALLQGGVPSVVAMRYDVGDDYARELAVEFYRQLLAHARPKSAAAALTMARRALLDPARPRGTRFHAGDHATPVLYGEEEPGLTLRPGRSPGLETRVRRLHRVAELTPAEHAHFVGRTWELAGLGAEFIGSGTGAEVKPVAVVTGLGGMGKTALAAEALALWEERFDWVLLYQGKPGALDFENTLRDVHLKLFAEVGRRYHEHVKDNPADAVHRAAGEDFAGDARLDRLTDNLVRAMRDEAILLVLDNFEANLKPGMEVGPSGEPLWACRDPAWDRCFRRLAAELAGTRSRVLVTSRRSLAALAGAAFHPVRLGPLPPGEAALYLRQHAGLGEMAFGGDEAERALARRLLGASRFHPLLMDRLARLATGGPELRPQLLRGLETLESRGDFDRLPELFAATRGDADELAYLEDALAVSLDQLIRDAGADARRLLWMIAIANEPVTLALLRTAWERWISEPEKLLQRIGASSEADPIPVESRDEPEAPPARPVRRDPRSGIPESADPAPLLNHLAALALATTERDGPADDNPNATCHELVRERIHAWMREHPEDRGGVTENAIRLVYAERLALAFEAFAGRELAAAVLVGRRAIVYCVQAGAYDRLSGFASGIINHADIHTLHALLPHLEIAAASAPEGHPRWNCLGLLADALRLGGRPDASLPFYEQAVAQARAAAEAGGEDSRRAWADVAWITSNWAHGLLAQGDVEAARRRRADSAHADLQAGTPPIHVVAGELEILRIDIRQGRAEAAHPEVERRLARVEEWWRRHRSGERVAEAPDPDFLATVLIGALDIANEIAWIRRDWASALERTDATLEIQRVSGRPPLERLRSRVNRATELKRLGRFPEARAELEGCLQSFQDYPVHRATVLSSLADLFDDQGDVDHAIVQERRALAIREQLPEPRERVVSHTNLANFLDRRGVFSGFAEASRHQLAGLVYGLVSGLDESVGRSLYNYGIDFRLVHDSGFSRPVPRLADLLADPAFHPLAEWLRQRRMDVEALQDAIDQVLDEVRRSVAAQVEAGGAAPSDRPRYAPSAPPPP